MGDRNQGSNQYTLPLLFTYPSGNKIVFLYWVLDLYLKSIIRQILLKILKTIWRPYLSGLSSRTPLVTPRCLSYTMIYHNTTMIKRSEKKNFFRCRKKVLLHVKYFFTRTGGPKHVKNYFTRTKYTTRIILRVKGMLSV